MAIILVLCSFFPRNGKICCHKADMFLDLPMPLPAWSWLAGIFAVFIFIVYEIYSADLIVTV